jgi:transposase-like protein
MRKVFTAKLKAQIALEAIKNESTIAQISQRHGVHPTQIQRWKAEALSKLETVFGKTQPTAVDEKYVEALERKAGQLAIEVDFLKKNLNSYHGKNGSK